MDPTSPPSLPVPTLPRWLHAIWDAWRIHGVMAPGVRLMRRINVFQKALVLGVAFLGPVAVLGLAQYRAATDLGVQTRQERAVLQELARLYELLQVVQDRRQAVLDGAGRDRSAPADWPPHLREWPGELGPRLAARQAALFGDDPQEAAQAGSALADEVLAIAREAMQRSDLAVDADAVTHDLATLALLGLPDLAVQLQHLHELRVSLVARDEGDAGNWLQAAAALARAERALADIRLSRARVASDPAGLLIRGELETLLQAAAAQLAASRAALAGGAAVVGRTPDGAAGAASPAASADTLAQLVVRTHALQQRLITQLNERLVTREQQLTNGMLRGAALLSACVALAFYLLLAAYRVMRGGLELLRANVERMARGDLSAPRRPLGQDEVADALTALRDSLGRLGDLFAAVKRGVASVSHASAEIAAGNRDLVSLTERTRQGVSDIEGGAQAIAEQLEACGRLVDQAVTAARSMRSQTARSRKAVGELRESMAVLQARSREITEVVTLIDGIAFQTNILALNASVEAARVGEAGKGFAVVADQVRSLAQRSVEVAEQIGTIAAASVADIQSGYRVAERASEAVDATAANAEAVSTSMAEVVGIVRAGQEHTRQVRESVHAVRQALGGNGRLVEQLSAATDGLREQGAQLSDQVSSFKLG